jgi:hypothetical protein
LYFLIITTIDRDNFAREQRDNQGNWAEDWDIVAL